MQDNGDQLTSGEWKERYLRSRDSEIAIKKKALILKERAKVAVVALRRTQQALTDARGLAEAARMETARLRDEKACLEACAHELLEKLNEEDQRKARQEAELDQLKALTTNLKSHHKDLHRTAEQRLLEYEGRLSSVSEQEKRARDEIAGLQGTIASLRAFVADQQRILEQRSGDLKEAYLSQKELEENLQEVIAGQAQAQEQCAAARAQLLAMETRFAEQAQRIQDIQTQLQLAGAREEALARERDELEQEKVSWTQRDADRASRLAAVSEELAALRSQSLRDKALAVSVEAEMTIQQQASQQLAATLEMERTSWKGQIDASLSLQAELEEKVSRLRDAVSEREEALAKERAVNAGQATRLVELAALKDRVAQLVSASDVDRAGREHLEDELRHIRLREDSLKGRLSDLEAARCLWADRDAALQLELEQTGADRARLRESLQSLQDSNQQLQARVLELDQVNQRLLGCEQAWREAEDVAVQRERSVEALKETLSRGQRELAAAEGRCQEQTDLVAQHTQELSRLQDDLRQEQLDKDSLRQELTLAQARERSAAQEIEGLRLFQEELTRRLRTLQEREKELHRDKQELLDEAKEATLSVATLEVEKERLLAELGRLTRSESSEAPWREAFLAVWDLARIEIKANEALS